MQLSWFHVYVLYIHGISTKIYTISSKENKWSDSSVKNKSQWISEIIIKWNILNLETKKGGRQMTIFLRFTSLPSDLPLRLKLY